MKLKTDFGVRALLATIVVGIATIALAYMAVTGSREALVALVAEFSGVLGYYFGQRSKANVEK